MFWLLECGENAQQISTGSVLPSGRLGIIKLSLERTVNQGERGKRRETTNLYSFSQRKKGESQLKLHICQLLDVQKKVVKCQSFSFHSSMKLVYKQLQKKQRRINHRLIRKTFEMNNNLRLIEI